MWCRGDNCIPFFCFGGWDGVGGVKKIVCHFRAEKYSGPVFVVQNLTP